MFLFLPNDGGTVGGLEFVDRVVMVALCIVVGVVTVLVFVWDLLTGKGRRTVFFAVIRAKTVDKHVLHLRTNVC